MIFGSLETTILLLLASVFLAFAMWQGYRHSRDPLHPALILAPLFFLGMVAEPAQRLANPGITTYFPDYKGLPFALSVQFLGMACLFAGVLSVHLRITNKNVAQSLVDETLTQANRNLIRLVAWSLACFSLFGYWYGIYLIGGFVKAYSSAKGGVVFMSGYIGEAQNLGVAALVFYALSYQKRRITTSTILYGLLMISPILLQGLFGGRRGPLFIAAIAIFVSYYIAKGRVPKLSIVATAMGILVVGLVFLGSQRGNLYFGSGKGFEIERFWEALRGEEVSAGDNFVVSSGAVIAISELHQYHWGRRMLVTYLVRPIPREFWPRKYDDISGLLYGKSFSEVQNMHYGWASALGWRPLNGFAINAIVDLYWEFSWLYAVVLWLLGRGIAQLWCNFRTKGGYWFVGYFLITALSIYLPTQSFSAFAHRFLYLSVMSYVFWRFTIGKQQAREQSVARLAPVPVRRSKPESANAP